MTLIREVVQNWIVIANVDNDDSPTTIITSIKLQKKLVPLTRNQNVLIS